MTNKIVDFAKDNMTIEDFITETFVNACTIGSMEIDKSEDKTANYVFSCDDEISTIELVVRRVYDNEE